VSEHKAELKKKNKEDLATRHDLTKEARVHSAVPMHVCNTQFASIKKNRLQFVPIILHAYMITRDKACLREPVLPLLVKMRLLAHRRGRYYSWEVREWLII
jgi:hypothetical protein